MSLSFASILLFSSSLVTPCVLVPCWLAWSELSVKKRHSVTRHIPCIYNCTYTIRRLTLQEVRCTIARTRSESILVARATKRKITCLNSCNQSTMRTVMNHAPSERHFVHVQLRQLLLFMQNTLYM